MAIGVPSVTVGTPTGVGGWTGFGADRVLAITVGGTLRATVRQTSWAWLIGVIPSDRQTAVSQRTRVRLIGRPLFRDRPADGHVRAGSIIHDRAF